MRQPAARAQTYNDNLAGARERGASGNDAHGSPVVDSEARRYAASLLKDPIYRRKLVRRLRNGEAQALEIWLHRWMLGDPQAAKEATGEADRKRFEELREGVREQIRAALVGGRMPELEAQVLGPVPARRALLTAGPAIEVGDGPTDEAAEA